MYIYIYIYMYRERERERERERDRERYGKQLYVTSSSLPLGATHNVPSCTSMCIRIHNSRFVLS